MASFLFVVFVYFYWPFILAGLCLIALFVLQYKFDGLAAKKKNKQRRDALLKWQKTLLVIAACLCALNVGLIVWHHNRDARQEQATLREGLKNIHYPIYELQGSFAQQFSVVERIASIPSYDGKSPAEFKTLYQSKIVGQGQPIGTPDPSLLYVDLKEYDARLATFGANGCLDGGPKLQSLVSDFAGYTCKPIGEWQRSPVYGAYGEVTDPDTHAQKQELGSAFAVKGGTLIYMGCDSQLASDYMKAFQALRQVDPYNLHYFFGGA